jgi:glycine/D-amino acid oxidase-like deaminating enzyme
MSEYDIIIVGGGATGSATAYYLTQFDSRLSIAVFERDPTYEYCSTLRSDGNLRTQFSLEENIRMSQFTFELLADFASTMAIDDWRPDLAPRHQGNLFLTDAAGVAAAESGMAVQHALGCEVDWLDPADIARRWPAYRTEGVAGGVFGPKDGTIDSHALLHGFRRNALRRGVDYVAAEVAGIIIADDAVRGVRLADGTDVGAPTVANCAGGWAAGLARTAGIELPVTPVMRTVFSVDTMIGADGLPLVVTPNGAYALPEGGKSFSMAWSRPSDPVGFDFRFSRAGFQDVVWPEIVATLPAFDELTVTGGWTGIYAVNQLDGNALLGAWDAVQGLYVATGFSGHGFQHTPAMGRYLAELIVGREPTIDLQRLSPRRVLEGHPLFEHAGRIV